jgi:hypothetical protein
MPRKENNFNKGLKMMLNDPRTAPFAGGGNAAFKAVIQESGMSMTDVFSHLGKNKGKARPKPPTDAELSAARVEKLETSTNE